MKSCWELHLISASLRQTVTHAQGANREALDILTLACRDPFQTAYIHTIENGEKQKNTNGRVPKIKSHNIKKC